MNEIYDIIIVGGGPIGASTAYHLSQKQGVRVALITEEGEDDTQTSTYKFAGGSVRMWWTDPKMAEMTGETADFINSIVEDGIDIGAVKDRYVLVHRGIEVPSWNINSRKLVSYFLSKAGNNGASIFKNTKVDSIEQEGGMEKVITSGGVFTARKVVLATGSNINKILSGSPFSYKKRELLVFDLELSVDALRFPHTVVPLAHGLVFGFIKNIDGKERFVLGQEDLLEYSGTWEEEDFLPQLVSLGLYNLMPFLKDAKVLKILWGFDSVSKFPEFFSPRETLLAVTCGSAVRSCVWIGREIVNKIIR